MDKINVFISYSSEEKKISGRLKRLLLKYCGYTAFIAHDDIPASEVWENEILNSIKKSDFFIPLISQSFKTSDYADQETGYAVSLNKKIIPVKLDNTNPYGFINKFQALQYKKSLSSQINPWNNKLDNLDQIAISIAYIGLHYQLNTKYYKQSLNSLVFALCNSDSFEATNAIIEILSNCNHRLTKVHLDEITKAISTNSQITGAFGLPDLKKILLIKYKCHID